MDDALARFHRDEDAARIRELGAVPIRADLADPASLRALPADIDYVLNFAVAKSGRWTVELYGKNVGDARGITSYGNSGTPNFGGSIGYTPPRTIGALVTARF